MPRGRPRGPHIPPAARTILRRALVTLGDRICSHERSAAPHTLPSGGLECVAQMLGVDHSHLCRILPTPNPDGTTPLPRRRASFELLVGLLAEIPRADRDRIRHIAETAGEEGLTRAITEAEAPLKRMKGRLRIGVAS